MHSRISIVLLSCAAAGTWLFSGCLDPSDNESGVQTVPLPGALAYFDADSAGCAQLERTRTARSPYVDGEGGLNKRLVAIPTTSVKILSTWSDEAITEEWEEEPGQDYWHDFWIAREWATHLWKNQVDYYSGSPYEELLYTGVLERSGDYASGEVAVKKGITDVLVGFMADNNDSMHTQGLASYYWGVDGVADGWYYDTEEYPYERVGPVAIVTWGDSVPAADTTDSGTTTGWTTFTTTNSELPNANVNALASDSNGMWIGTYGGLSYWSYQDSSWTNYTTVDGLPGNAVIALRKITSGGLWIGTTQGLAFYSGISFSQFTTSDSDLPSNFVSDIAEDAYDVPWFATNAGLASYDHQGTPQTWTTYTTADGLSGNIVLELEGDLRGNMWVGTTMGLSMWNGTTFTNYSTTETGLTSYTVDALKVNTATDEVWIGTAGGLSLYSGNTWHPTTLITPSGFSSDDVKAIELKGDGSIWGGTFAGEFFEFDLETFTRTPITTLGLPDGAIRAIVQHPNGDLWIATTVGILRRQF